MTFARKRDKDGAVSIVSLAIFAYRFCRAMTLGASREFETYTAAAAKTPAI
jgi:hypothetical protein